MIRTQLKPKSHVCKKMISQIQKKYIKRFLSFKKRRRKEKVWKLLKVTDYRLFWFFNAKLQCSVLDWLLPRLTHCGSAGGTILITLTTLAYGYFFNIEDVFRAGKAMSFALIFSHSTVHLLKRKFNRKRPHLAIQNMFKDIRFFEGIPICPYSFPSGHTNASFAIAVAMHCYLPGLGVALLSLACIIAFSRIYLGIHYVSDVLVGVSIGYLFGSLSSGFC